MFDDEKIEFAASMPFKRNTLASFFNVPIAVHAAPNPGPARRYVFTGIDLKPSSLRPVGAATKDFDPF
jgi:hypothetical protein